MKFIVIIIAIVVIYYLTKSLKKEKVLRQVNNNIVLCEKCGFHTTKELRCDSQAEIDNCINKGKK